MTESSNTMEFHPACLLLPKMDADEYEALRESIRGGYNKQHPIVTHDGKILDGRHRYMACQEVGTAPIFVAREDVNPFEHVRVEHEARRSWKSKEQKVLVLGALYEGSDAWADTKRMIQDAATQARADAAKKRDRDTDGTFKPVCPQPVDRPVAARGPGTQAKAALMGVNRGAVERAETIRRKSPELAVQVAQGEIAATKAIREIRRKETIENLENTKAKEAKAVDGVFDVIVIDPPWPMKKIERDVRPNQSEFDYPTMEEDELLTLKIPAATDCHLWLWTTHRFLPMALRLLGEWGLKYVCAFVWHKPGGFQPVGLPQFNCEFALYARKGSPSFVDTKALPTCFDAPRGAHSEKPSEFYDTVRRVTAGRRLDMFGRRAIDGFESWGKEAV
jgi:N6-adenosine-specific RNA methylase IME4